MAQVKWTLQSAEDAESIAQFISKDSGKYARLQIERFLEQIRILEKHPFAGRIVPKLNIKSIRELIVGSYRIIYKIIDEDNIDIITIHHSARRIKKSMLKRR